MQTIPPSQPQPENKFPDCVFLDLKACPTSTLSKPGAKEVNLELSINFEEEWLHLCIGSICFGLTSGELRLTLTNAKIPLHLRDLDKKLDCEIEKSRQMGKSELRTRDTTSSIGATITTKPDLSTSAKVGTKKEESASQSDQFTITASQITSKGSPNYPAWVFKDQTGDHVLKGSLVKKRLATMNLSASAWKVVATFEVPTLKDVRVTKTEGILLHNVSININKITSLRIGLAKLLMKHKFQPYISRTVIEHG